MKDLFGEFLFMGTVVKSKHTLRAFEFIFKRSLKEKQ